MTDNITTKQKNIWYLSTDQSSVQRVSNNGTIITLPVTTESLNEIKTQMEATQNAKKIFENVSIDNENIIAYLYLLLDQYINFLEFDNLNYLINMMKQLEESTYVDANNASFINKLRISYDTDIYAFYDVLEEFKNYNMAYLSKFYNAETSVKSH